MYFLYGNSLLSVAKFRDLKNGADLCSSVIQSFTVYDLIIVWHFCGQTEWLV